MSTRLAAVIALSAVPLLAGCAGSSGGSGGSSGEALKIEASFYPLQYVTQRIAGDRAQVGSLTPPGAEPHDLEVTPEDVAAANDADLDRTVTEDGSTGADPHFWLDPVRLTAVSTLIEQRLAKLDPAGASTYAANLTSLTGELATLDTDMKAELATRQNKDLVTSHEAFGYLAERYGMTQVGITGLSPEAEPAPATLAEVADFVRQNKVPTAYYETLVSPAIARTVAGETGARTEVLDPIEGITSKSPGQDYFAVMRANLANSKEGQPCS